MTIRAQDRLAGKAHSAAAKPRHSRGSKRPKRGHLLLERLEDRWLPNGGPGLVPAYGNLPLNFEANQGQTDPSVQFLSRGAGYGLFLRQSDAVLTLTHPQAA